MEIITARFVETLTVLGYTDVKIMGVKDVITGRLLASASDKFSDSQVADTLQLLIMHGLEGGANTIHIEPHERFVLVRYRIDGALRGVHKLPREASEMLMRQLKTLSDLEPNEIHTPQEGHYSTEVGGQNLHVRLSIMPVLGGEKAVLHLRPEQISPLELEKLGFWGSGLDYIHEALARPHGLIVVTGPKHSGKSTTLYSMLELVNNPTYSIATIEEHKTHRLHGASQSYVRLNKGGTTMLDGLQAVLHQDPNIIMLGSLPDRAVAELAVQTASSGHLLLTEMHNDSAVTSVLHLKAMNVEPFLLATALRVAVGQRLVRRLCPDCRERYTLDEARTKKLEDAFGITSQSARTRIAELEHQAARAGLTDEPGFNTPDGLPRLWRPAKNGCENCAHTGFKGRLALTEVLVNNDGIQKRLLAQGAVTANELHKAALKDDFVPMGLDGLIKALCGLTTITEVLRAAGRINS